MYGLHIQPVQRFDRAAAHGSKIVPAWCGESLASKRALIHTWQGKQSTVHLVSYRSLASPNSAQLNPVTCRHEEHAEAGGDCQ